MKSIFQNIPEIFNLSSDQKKAVEEGIQSIESEEVYSNTETKRIVEEWFNKNQID